MSRLKQTTVVASALTARPCITAFTVFCSQFFPKLVPKLFPVPTGLVRSFGYGQKATEVIPLAIGCVRNRRGFAWLYQHLKDCSGFLQSLMASQPANPWLELGCYEKPGCRS